RPAAHRRLGDRASALGWAAPDIMFVKRGGPFRPLRLMPHYVEWRADRQRLSQRTRGSAPERPAFTAGHAEGREAVCAQGRAQSAFHCTPLAYREPANLRTVQPH
ncbi:hypothetical protein, partial [Photorhabdus asymbiotica]|uniref:hypothetical protein n=1 Tax=Photorhabdus asymbiotica TaxID=291112 RepID=UPI001B88499A